MAHGAHARRGMWAASSVSGLVYPTSTLFAGIADLGITTASGNVSQWTSQDSPSYSATNSDSATRPPYVAPLGAGPGGRAYMTASGTTFLQANPVATNGSWTNNGPFTVFAIVNCASQTNVLISVGATVTNYAMQLEVVTTGRVQIRKRGSSDAGSVTAVTSTNAFTNGSWTVIGAVCAGTTVDIYGGVTTTPDSVGAAFSSVGGLTTPTLSRIIGVVTATAWTGSVAGVFIDDVAWSAPDVAAFMASVTNYYAGAVT
jgi:hypothetical protein